MIVRMGLVKDGRSGGVPGMGLSGPSVFGDDELLQFLFQAPAPGGDKFFKSIES